MNKNSFLDYYKTILKKVSFDRQLLSKEYRKAKQMLGASDARELDSWLHRNGFTHLLDAVSDSKADAWRISPQQGGDRI